jgi:hypothetical protein
MANTANVQANLSVLLTTDSNTTLASGQPITVLCNRQYSITDYMVAVTTSAGEQNERIIVEISGGATQANVVAATAGWKRPSVFTVTAGDAGLLAAAAVPRASTLRVRALSDAGTLGASTRFSGTLAILPGNRYAAGAGTYYPNNSSALQA